MLNRGTSMVKGMLGTLVLAGFVIGTGASGAHAFGGKKPEELPPTLPVPVEVEPGIGEVVVGGSGCPAGSVQLERSPGGFSVRAIPSEFVAEAPSPQGSSFSRKTCQIALPVHVPQGFSVGTPRVALRGFHQLSTYSASVVSFEAFLAGSSGPRVEETFTGPGEIPFRVDNLVQGETTWSECGKDTMVRVNSSINPATNGLDRAFTLVEEIMIEVPLRKCAE